MSTALIERLKELVKEIENANNRSNSTLNHAVTWLEKEFGDYNQAQQRKEYILGYVISCHEYGKISNAVFSEINDILRDL